MTHHRAKILIVSDIVEVESDMRDRLVANLRNQTRQSGAIGQAGAEGEPQAVLIKNRKEDLAGDVIRLRNRYAHILAE